MAVTRYTKMAYDCADDMVFGKAKQPVSYGFGLKIGAGEVIPEVNYAPRPGTEKDADRLRKEYVDYISKDILNRAVTAGFPNVQLETEWVSQMNQAKLSAPVVEGQKAICEKYHEEYGVNCAVRHTIPDQREAEEGLRPGMGGSHAYPEKLFECAEIACENGADNLSCESVGGKEFADYAVTNGDIVAFLFGVGYLGSIDMTYIWSEFSEIAKKNKCKFRFEGSVGGAMPIINLCRENLRGEKIESIRGIFNGTCNFILSKMDKGQPFDQALKEAQQMGYAETDPTNDIEGYDSACKVVILANSVFGRNVTFDDVRITGITGITDEAIALAASRNMVIRLIGEVSENKLEVGPRLVPKGHPLSISGTLNTAQIISDLAGPITVSGRGAGRIETASAILSDLISIMDERSE